MLVAHKKKSICSQAQIALACRGCHRPGSNTSNMQCSTAAAAGKDQVHAAFIIMASDNSWKGAPDISLLQELLRALDHPAFYVVIHVDQNSSQHFKDAVAALAAEHTRTSLARYPLGCTWAGWQCIHTLATNSIHCLHVLVLIRVSAACKRLTAQPCAQVGILDNEEQALPTSCMG